MNTQEAQKYTKFKLFEPMIADACAGYLERQPVNWNVTSATYSAPYIRDSLRACLINFTTHPGWLTLHSTITHDTCLGILQNWKFRTVSPAKHLPPTHVECGPRKAGFHSIEITGQLTDTPPSEDPSTPPLLTSLSIDGTNLTYLHAACVLKNFDQLSEPILLTNFNTDYLDLLLNTYPNIAIEQDFIAGLPTSNYILI